MTLKITEIFYSLQGEGSAAGYPFLFIRLAKCNLRCRYCDTGYSFDEGVEMTLPQIIEAIEKLPKTDKVLLTGGEPLLQKEGVTALISRLQSTGKKVFVETNGSLDLSFLPEETIRVVDVKTPSSGFSSSFLKSNLELLRPQDDLKFVIADRTDFNFSVNFILKYRLPGRCSLLFSPVFGEIEPAELARWILEEALPVRLSLQLHKILGLK